jgi:NAD(P)-dependent dehydrogenase (short-subunit alcohol dehydrogenase family)
MTRSLHAATEGQAPFSGRRLEGRLAVVTGGAHGIGRGIVQRLTWEGSAVAIVDRDAEAASKFAGALAEQGHNVLAVEADVTHPDQLAATQKAIAESFGRVPDIVVCNAGTQTFNDVWNLSVEEWDLIFDVNVKGAFLTMRTFAAAMRDHGVVGSLTTIASLQGRVGAPYYAHYAASKAALLSLTKSFATVLAPEGIRVNSVAPGAVKTRLWDRADGEIAALRGTAPGEPTRERVASVPLGRAGEPDDVAAAVAFLSSDDASYITGECIHVCGGDLML